MKPTSPTLSNGGEIVVQHEALRGFRRIQQFDALLVVLRAERRRHQRLRFAAREQRGTVRARQHPHFAHSILRT